MLSWAASTIPGTRADGTFSVVSFAPAELVALPAVITGLPVGVATIEKLFEGSLNGNHGTFNFVHSATTSGTDRTGEYFTIVPASGIGHLAGIAGTGGITIEIDGTHRIWFDYDIG